jgi:putative transposase
MTRKAHSVDEIVAKLRLVDELNLQGRAVGEAVQAIGVTEVTYYRWIRLYGELEYEVVKWLRELETENARLRRALGVSERRACRVLGQHRSTQRKRPKSLDGAGHDNRRRRQHSAVRHC